MTFSAVNTIWVLLGVGSEIAWTAVVITIMFSIIKATIGLRASAEDEVMGYGTQKGKPEYYRGTPVEVTLRPKVQVDIVVSKVPVRQVIETAKSALYTGHIGDGKIFVTDVENVVRVRTGEEGYDALQSE